MFFDPLYMFVMIIGAILSGGASMWVKSATSKWQKVPIGRGMTGREVAQKILDTKGIRDVRIERVPGRLSDHYDPRSKVLRLSPDIYNGRSVTAAGVAAHEVGHAIQHAEGYAPMTIRQLLVPVANIGTSMGIYMVMFGAFLGMTGLAKLGRSRVVLGAVLGSFLVVFYWFLYYFVEIDLTSFQDAFWSRLGAT